MVLLLSHLYPPGLLRTEAHDWYNLDTLKLGLHIVEIYLLDRGLVVHVLLVSCLYILLLIHLDPPSMLPTEPYDC